jgi:GT2 family glycosyltransferase
MDEMVSHACRPGIAAVGARLLYSDDTIKHAGFILGPGVIAANAHEKLPIFSPGFFGRAALIQSFSAVSSDCLFIEKAIYEEIGGMDDDDLAIVYNDVDFCLRLLEKGYRNIWTPYAQLYYFESRAKDETHVNKKYQSAYERMQSRWKASINNDPAYSPNLTLDLKNFSYAFPPRTVHVL